MNTNNNKIDKVVITDVNNSNILKMNIKIVKDCPSETLDESLEENLYDDVYIDDMICNIETDQTTIEDTTNAFQNIETPELLEVMVIEEIDSMIKTDYYDLERINIEINILNEKEEDSALLDEIIELKKQLAQIISKFELFEKKYDFIYKSLDYEKIKQMDSYYIKDLIAEYKSSLQNGNLLDEKFNLLTDIEECVNVINAIIEIDYKKDQLEEKIDEKLKRFEIRDDEFERMKEDYYSIDKINEFVTNFNNAQSQHLKNIKQLIDQSTNIEKKTEYKKALSINIGNALTGTLLIASIPLIPYTRRGNLLRAGIMIMGIAKLNAVINTHEQEQVTFDFNINSYAKELNDGMSNIRNVIRDIDNAFLDISLLRQKIKKEFAEYIYEIDEVKNLIKNINKVEKELAIQQEIAKNYENEFSITLQENNEKIKKLDK